MYKKKHESAKSREFTFHCQEIQKLTGHMRKWVCPRTAADKQHTKHAYLLHSRIQYLI